jgi:MotA/TolQ/ExbB proton channel family protein
MRRNVVDVLCAMAIFAIVIFLGAMEEKPKSNIELRGWGLTEFEAFKNSGIFGILQLICAALGAVKLVRCAVETRQSKLASPALMSGIRKQLDMGQIDQALSRAKSDSGYAGRVLAAALSRKSVGGDVRHGFEDAVALESSRLRGRADTLLGAGVVGFLVGVWGAVHGLAGHILLVQHLQSPTFADVTHRHYEILARLTYGTIIALVFVPSFLIMKRRISTKVLKVNAELGALLDRAAPQK